MDTSSPSFFPEGTFRFSFTGRKLSAWNIVPAGYRRLPPGVCNRTGASVMMYRFGGTFPFSYSCLVCDSTMSFM